MINSGGGDSKGSQRGLEYDTVSGLYAEFIEKEVLPKIEKDYDLKFSKDPDARATMMTGTSIRRSLRLRSVSSPSGPGGIIRSRNMASGSARSTVSNAAWPFPASSTVNPSARSRAPSIRRMLASSSTIRIR